jgi:flagellar hook-basal body complex protein FliE
MSDMGISAAKAYINAANTLARQTSPLSDAQEAGPDFGAMLNNAVSIVTKAGASAEGAITNASLGRGDLVDVVTAVAAAEATLETVISVRDEVIKAYQDIMRMPI